MTYSSIVPPLVVNVELSHEEAILLSDVLSMHLEGMREASDVMMRDETSFHSMEELLEATSIHASNICHLERIRKVITHAIS